MPKMMECRTNCAIFCFRIPRLKLFPSTRSRHRAISLRDIRSNAWLVVVKLVIPVPVKHAIDLEDVAVCLNVGVRSQCMSHVQFVSGFRTSVPENLLPVPSKHRTNFFGACTRPRETAP
jgi:hypothetical protein